MKILKYKGYTIEIVPARNIPELYDPITDTAEDYLVDSPCLVFLKGRSPLGVWQGTQAELDVIVNNGGFRSQPIYMHKDVMDGTLYYEDGEDLEIVGLSYMRNTGEAGEREDWLMEEAIEHYNNFLENRIWSYLLRSDNNNIVKDKSDNANREGYFTYEGVDHAVMDAKFDIESILNPNAKSMYGNGDGTITVVTK